MSYPLTQSTGSIICGDGWVTVSYTHLFVFRSIVRIMREISPRCFFSLSFSVYHLHKVYAENG